jgi:hypothetical protein
MAKSKFGRADTHFAYTVLVDGVAVAESGAQLNRRPADLKIERCAPVSVRPALGYVSGGFALCESDAVLAGFTSGDGPFRLD